MDPPGPIKCTSCKKEVATEVVRCIGCRGLFHPGCFKPHKILGPDGEKRACVSKAESLNRAGNARASAVAPSPPAISLTAPSSSSSSGSTRTPPVVAPTTVNLVSSAPTPSPDASIANVLAAVQACAATLQAFREEQLAHNAGTDGCIAELRKDLAGHMERLSTDLKAVSQRVRGVETRLSTLDTDVKATAAKQESLTATFNSRLDSVTERQRSYAEALRESQRVAGETVERVKALSSEVRRLQVERRSSEIIISGLPEKQGEDLRGLLRDTAVSLGTPLVEADIVRVSRMRGTPGVDRPRTVHAVLSSRARRDALIAGKRSKGKLLASELAADLGPRPLFINEYLPRDTWTLLRKVRAEARARGFSHVWHRDGRIFVKKDKDAAPIVIGEEAEIAAKLQ